MAKRSEVFTGSSSDTVIGSGVRLKGNLASEGDVSLDGTLQGDIASGGHVTIGPNAQMEGNIKATSAHIAGHLAGNIQAADSVSLTESAQLRGDIATERLEVSYGAIFIGSSQMKTPQAKEIGPAAPRTSERSS